MSDVDIHTHTHTIEWGTQKTVTPPGSLRRGTFGYIAIYNEINHRGCCGLGKMVTLC